jgi:hypothetical protein
MLVADKKVVALMDDPSKLDRHNFVYPEMIAGGRMYGEEVEEAVIEYLEKRGFSRDMLQSNGEWEYTDGDGSRHTTKLLMINLVG